MSAPLGASCLLDQVAPPAAAQPGTACLLEQSIATTRRLIAGIHTPWTTAQPRDRGIAAPAAAVVAFDRDARAPWGLARPLTASATLRWVAIRTADRAHGSAWGGYRLRGQGDRRAPWRAATCLTRDDRAPWGSHAARASASLSADWAPSRPLARADRAPWGTHLSRANRDAHTPHPLARPTTRSLLAPWGRRARTLNPDIGTPVAPGGPPTDEHGTVIVPLQRAYIVINEAHLTRDGVPLACLDLTVAIDADSWTWSLAATLAGDEWDAIQPEPDGTPAELVATINGYQVRARVEQASRSREFGARRVSVRARGIAAELDAPNAPATTRSNTAPVTAQQIAVECLTSNGVLIGAWAIDWQLDDWLVPAGAWSHQGTPISGVLRVAEAVGAIVMADPVATTLHLLPRYPVAPWGWSAATPDIVLPPDLCIAESIEQIERPRYNRAYASGETQGVLGQITRAGTAGDLPASLVTHPLLTAAEATRQRGRVILADTGRQARIGLSLPLADASGLLDLNALVHYADPADPWRGLVRGLTVTARWDRTLTVRQSVEIERHYLET